MIEKGEPGYGVELREDHGRYFCEPKVDYQRRPAEVIIERTEHRPMLPVVTSSCSIVTTVEQMLCEGWGRREGVSYPNRPTSEADMVIFLARGYPASEGGAWDAGWVNESACVVVRDGYRLMWDPD